MAQVNLNNKHYDKKDCLAINVGDKTYHMPLATNMPLKILKRLTKDADVTEVVDVLSNYIPIEVVDEFSASDVKQIFEAWGAASNEKGIESGK